MQTSHRFPFITIHIEGSLLPADLLQRVRRASKIQNVRYRVEPQLHPDVLEIFIYLPID
jgi:hypothetical protein